MAAADKKELEDLHESLAKVLSEAIAERELKVIEVPEGTKLPDGEVAGEGGKKVAVMVRNAAVLNVARQFLKDNDIKASPVKGKPLANLAEQLPFAGSEDDVVFGEPPRGGLPH